MVRRQNTKTTAVLSHKVHSDHLCMIQSDCVVQSCKSISSTSTRQVNLWW